MLFYNKTRKKDKFNKYKVKVDHFYTLDSVKVNIG